MSGLPPAAHPRYDPAWGWPPATMTEEQDRADPARNEREIAAHFWFNYGIGSAWPFRDLVPRP